MPSPDPLAPLLAAVFDRVTPRPTRLRPVVIGRPPPVRRLRRRRVDHEIDRPVAHPSQGRDWRPVFLAPPSWA